MKTFPFIKIMAHTSGFTVHIHDAFDTIPRETHCVAGFEQLTELLDKIIVSKGRGQSARYEIRPFTHDVPVRTGDNGDGTFSVERVVPRTEPDGTVVTAPLTANDTIHTFTGGQGNSVIVGPSPADAAHEAAKVRLHKAAVEQGKI